MKNGIGTKENPTVLKHNKVTQYFSQHSAEPI